LCSSMMLPCVEYLPGGTSEEARALCGGTPTSNRRPSPAQSLVLLWFLEWREWGISSASAVYDEQHEDAAGILGGSIKRASSL